MPKTTETDVSVRAVVGHHSGPRHPRFPHVNVAQTARLLGLNKGFLSNVLKGKARPAITNAINIARAFNITVEELNGYYQERTKETRKETTTHAKSKSSGRTKPPKRKRAA